MHADGVSIGGEGEPPSTSMRDGMCSEREGINLCRHSGCRVRRHGWASSRALLNVALLVIAVEHMRQAGEGQVAGGEVDGDEPGAGDVDEVVEPVGEGDAVHGAVHGEEEEEDVGNMTETGWRVSESRGRTEKAQGVRREGDSHLIVILGIIVPPVNVSTSTRKGIMDKTLWCDENGVSQCTARLCTQTTSTGRLIGRIQSMRMRME